MDYFDVPIGGTAGFPSTVPDNWFQLRGQELNRSTYATLFNIIGTSYGAGDGSTTFNLPDVETFGEYLRCL